MKIGNPLFKFRDSNSIFGRYPSCDLLNNALRDLRNFRHEAAAREIVHAILKADGYFYADLEEYVNNILEDDGG